MRLAGMLALQASRLRVKNPSSVFTLIVASHCMVAIREDIRPATCDDSFLSPKGTAKPTDLRLL